MDAAAAGNVGRCQKLIDVFGAGVNGVHSQSAAGNPLSAFKVCGGVLGFGCVCGGGGGGEITAAAVCLCVYVCVCVFGGD